LQIKNKQIKTGEAMKSSLRARLRDKNGRELLDTKFEANVEKRFTKRTGKALQIVWKDNKIVHLHCKGCDNEWKIKDSPSWSSKFEMNGDKIKCLKCNKEYKAD
jgi:hypothetical protein